MNPHKETLTYTYSKRQSTVMVSRRLPGGEIERRGSKHGRTSSLPSLSAALSYVHRRWCTYHPQLAAQTRLREDLPLAAEDKASTTTNCHHS